MKAVITLWAFACISGCTTGTAVVTGQARSPIDPVAVTFYDEPPARYDVVGIVEAASNVRVFSLEAAQERAFAELKEQAAEIGGNGVIDWEVGERSYTNSIQGDQITVTVKGTAIYVAPNSQNQ